MDPVEEGDGHSKEERSERSDRSSRETSQKPPPLPPGKRALSDKQRDELEEMLRSLVPDRSVQAEEHQPSLSVCRNAIAEAMVWCIEHADSGEEIVECLAESLSILEVSRAARTDTSPLLPSLMTNIHLSYLC